MGSAGYGFVGATALETIELLRATVPAADFVPLRDEADLTWRQSMDQGALLASVDPATPFPVRPTPRNGSSKPSTPCTRTPRRSTPA